MGRIGKTFALFLTLIIAMSCLTLLTVKPVNAQSALPTSSVPEFAMKVVGSSIEVTIKNQPLTTYENGSYPNLYYGFRFKDHENIQDWNYAPVYYAGISSYGTYYNASASDYTAVSFPLRSYPLTDVLDSGQIDLQVIALIGNEVPTNYENGSVYGFDGAESNWSTTQTITILNNSASPTPTTPEFPTNTVPDTDAIPISTILNDFIFILVIILAVVISLLIYRRHRTTSDKSK